MQRKLHYALWMAAVLWAVSGGAAQSMRVQDIAVGKLLVSPRDAPDPNFGQAVILLVQHDPQGTVGLMINRRTEVPIARALEEFKPAKGKTDPIYMGGPMELDGVMALLRLGAKPSDAAHVLGDVYLSSSRKLVEKTLTAGTGPGEFRLYMGYCGWGADQLEHEVELHVWYIFGGTAGLVFDSNPSSLWSRLISRTEGQVARSIPPKRLAQSEYNQ